MKLSELKTSENVKVLVYGPSSTGKTCFACSFPGPIRYMDFDNKISSAAEFYKSEPQRLEQIDVTQFAPMSMEARMKTFTDALIEIQKLQHANKPLPFKTFVIDSLTTFTHYLLEDYIHVSQKGIKRPTVGINAMQDYQFLDKHMTQFVTGILSLSCNVVFIGHSKLDKDEATGSITNSILMPGQFSSKLPIYFEEVYYSLVDAAGKFQLQTVSDAKTTCRTQRRLAPKIPSSYQSIVGAQP